MKISIIGTGYVGLVTGACLADSGHQVLCLDIDQRKVDILNAGGIPIHEPGLDAVVARNLAAGRIGFTSDPALTAAFGEVIFLAVPTPSSEDGSADLQHVLAAARTLGRLIVEPKVIVDKSTVPVGTADAVRDAIADELLKRGVSVDFSVVSNPEFLKEGAAIEDFQRPDRIVIGCDSPRAEAKMREVYAPFQRNHERMIVMDVRSAELTKYAANAMLATRISFMNEMAKLAERLGADIEMVRRGIGSDPRIGHHFLYPGCGYGGSCFPKDVKAVIHTATDNGMVLQVMEAVERANEMQKAVLEEKIVRRFGEDLSGLTFAVWGLAFKPDTDDMREASSRVLVPALLARGARVKVYDPVALDNARTLFGEKPGLTYCTEAQLAVFDADALVIVTEWKEFRSPNFQSLQSLRTRTVFDGRNLYEPAQMAAHGLEYHCIGRPTVGGAHGR